MLSYLQKIINYLPIGSRYCNYSSIVYMKISENNNEIFLLDIFYFHKKRWNRLPTNDGPALSSLDHYNVFNLY